MAAQSSQSLVLRLKKNILSIRRERENSRRCQEAILNLPRLKTRQNLNRQPKKTSSLLVDQGQNKFISRNNIHILKTMKIYIFELERMSSSLMKSFLSMMRRIVRIFSVKTARIKMVVTKACLITRQVAALTRSLTISTKCQQRSQSLSS